MADEPSIHHYHGEWTLYPPKDVEVQLRLRRADGAEETIWVPLTFLADYLRGLRPPAEPEGTSRIAESIERLSKVISERVQRQGEDNLAEIIRLALASPDSAAPAQNS